MGARRGFLFLDASSPLPPFDVIPPGAAASSRAVAFRASHKQYRNRRYQMTEGYFGMGHETINVRFWCEGFNDESLAKPDRIAKGAGAISAAEVRELARLTAIGARQANAMAALSQRIASIGPLKVG